MAYYYMNKEHGNLLTENALRDDASENGYDDMTDPTSVEYGNWQLHYSETNYAVK